jgi:hypothetical protein
MSSAFLLSALGTIATVVSAAAAVIQTASHGSRGGRGFTLRIGGRSYGLRIARVFDDVHPKVRNAFALAFAAGFFELLILISLLATDQGQSSAWYTALLIPLAIAAWSAVAQLLATFTVMPHEGRGGSGCLGFMISAMLVMATFLADAAVIVSVVRYLG